MSYLRALCCCSNVFRVGIIVNNCYASSVFTCSALCTGNTAPILFICRRGHPVQGTQNRQSSRSVCQETDNSTPDVFREWVSDSLHTDHIGKIIRIVDDNVFTACQHYNISALVILGQTCIDRNGSAVVGKCLTCSVNRLNKSIPVDKIFISNNISLFCTSILSVLVISKVYCLSIQILPNYCIVATEYQHRRMVIVPSGIGYGSVVWIYNRSNIGRYSNYCTIRKCNRSGQLSSD